MTSTNQEIWKLLDGDISVQKNLSRGIINIRALAKFLIAKYNLNTSLDSAISAIRRYESDNEFTEGEITSVFKSSKISTNNGIACITMKIEGYYKNLKKIIENLSEQYRISTGPSTVKIIFDSRSESKIRSLIGKNSIIRTEKNLSEISISLNEKSIRTKGILARISNEISLNHINISESILCPPELLFYVKESDLVKTHETLIGLCE